MFVFGCLNYSMKYGRLYHILDAMNIYLLPEHKSHTEMNLHGLSESIFGDVA